MKRHLLCALMLALTALPANAANLVKTYSYFSVGGSTLDDIALMATINSVLANRFQSYFWTGFYRVCADRLVVGPYIGTVGCLQIEFGRGVCAKSNSGRS